MPPKPDLPVFAETIGWEEAEADLEARELGDGLPLARISQTT